jgi:hypothetical protein
MGADGKSRVHRDVFGVVGSSGSTGYVLSTYRRLCVCIYMCVCVRVCSFHLDFLVFLCLYICHRDSV